MKNLTIQRKESARSTPFSNDQRGSTMIAVLLILILITVLGTMAMRQGLTTLNISTNSQVRQLLVQAADTPLNQFLQMNQNQADLSQMLSVAGVFGIAINGKTTTPLQEYVFCYRPKSGLKFGLAPNATVITGDSTGVGTVVNSSSAGYCDLTTDFGSSRNATVTQVAVTVPTDTTSTVCATCTTSDQSTNNGIPPSYSTAQRLRVTSTAILPAFSTTDPQIVQAACLGKTGSPGKISDNADPSLSGAETLTDCLARYGMPSNTQVQDFNQINSLTQTASPISP